MKHTLENAEEIIERFGGIRPMAKKMDVAVTTVQGWKKRNVIPAGRYEDVLKAAHENAVDLTGLLPAGAAVKAPSAPKLAKDDTSAALLGKGTYVERPPESKSSFADNVAQAANTASRPASQIPLEAKLAKAEQTAIAKSTWINLVLLAVAVCAILAVMWPQNQDDAEQAERIAALEEDVQEMQAEQDKQGFMGALIPKDLNQQIETLKDQAGQAQESMREVAKRAEAISTDVLSENAGTLEERYSKLQVHLAEIANSPALQAMAQKLQALQSSPAGEAQLNSAVSQLNAVITGLYSVPGEQAPGEPLLETALQSAREQSSVLGETFEGVPAEDLKAAALLLGMTQFRSSLGRDNEAFDDDLQVLLGLVGEDNPELKMSLERLAPYSEQGVLTPAGLSEEFKTMAGDAVVASLKGENVDVTERAKARMNEVFQVEKDGALVTGTDTQATLNSAENLLAEGNLEGAILEVQSLQGPAAEATKPWLTKAQATLMAQRAKHTLEELMASVQGGGMVYNEGTPLNYRRAPYKSAPQTAPFELP